MTRQPRCKEVRSFEICQVHGRFYRELNLKSFAHPNLIAGKAPTLAPFAPASPDDLDKQHELGQFLTPNLVAEFMASLFEIHRSEVHLIDAEAGAGTPGFKPLECTCLASFYVRLACR